MVDTDNTQCTTDDRHKLPTAYGISSPQVSYQNVKLKNTVMKEKAEKRCTECIK